MEITDVCVQVSKNQVSSGTGSVLAQASIIIDGCFRVTGIRVVEQEGGSLLVAMPSERLKNPDKDSKYRFKDVAYPLNQKTRDYITDEVLKVYQSINTGKSK